MHHALDQAAQLPGVIEREAVRPDNDVEVGQNPQWSELNSEFRHDQGAKGTRIPSSADEFANCLPHQPPEQPALLNVNGGCKWDAVILRGTGTGELGAL